MARRTAREKQEGFRREVKFRLTNIRLELRKIRWNYESEVNPKSDSPALYIDPTYQFWALHALIYAGWGPKNFEDCYPLVDQLYDASSREAAGEKLDELEKRLTAGRIAL